MSEDDFIDEFFKKIFTKTNFKISLDKVKITLISFFIFGFGLRLIAARNLGVFADDVNHAVQPIGIIGSGKLVSWSQSTALWYYIQEVFYKIIGLTPIGSRFAAALFGSLLIIVMYLFVKRVFKSEKAALAASFLIAVSPMLIKQTLPEMDITTAFFTIFSAYFLFGYFESKAKKDLILSAVFIGIATMIKFYALFFAVSFFIYFILRQIIIKEDGQITLKLTKLKKILSRAFLFALIVLIMLTPTFAHNALLYADKGFMDLEFTNILKLGIEEAAPHYSWGAGWSFNQEKWTDVSGFYLGALGNQVHYGGSAIPGMFLASKPLLLGSPILFILGLIGLFFVFKKHKDYFWFFLIVFFPAFTFLGANIPMTKHLIWILVLFAPLAGKTIEVIVGKLKGIKLVYILVLILIFSLFYLGMPRGIDNSQFYAQSSYNQLVEYKDKEIPDNALVVADSRIYRGNIHWAFAGKSYVEASQFFDIAQQLSSQGNQQNIPVYYVECVIDDCGWGTIHNQPEFNKQMEEVTEWFANYSVSEEDFEAPSLYEYHLPFMGEKETRYRIYKLTLVLNPQILDAVKQTHVWFLYPIGYDRSISPIFDDYETRGIGTVFNGFAWMIHYLELMLAFFAVFYVFYLFLRTE